MARELIHVDNGRVTWSSAVAKVARALNPMGDAADIVASIGACVVEIGQLRLEAMRLSRADQIINTVLRVRGETIVRIFEEQKALSADARVSAAALREGYQIALREASDKHISEDERTIMKGTLPVLSGHIVAFHANAGNHLVRLSEGLTLDNTNMAVAALRSLYARP